MFTHYWVKSLCVEKKLRKKENTESQTSKIQVLDWKTLNKKQTKNTEKTVWKSDLLPIDRVRLDVSMCFQSLWSIKLS